MIEAMRKLGKVQGNVRGARRGVVFLHDDVRVAADDPLLMLRVQYRVLMLLSERYKHDEQIQNAICDANTLGLEVVDLLKEKEEA